MDKSKNKLSPERNVRYNGANTRRRTALRKEANTCAP